MKIEVDGLFKSYDGKIVKDINKIEKLLEMVHLDDNKEMKTKALSVGMRQRLGIAVALIGERICFW